MYLSFAGVIYKSLQRDGRWASRLSGVWFDIGRADKLCVPAPILVRRKGKQSEIFFLIDGTVNLSFCEITFWWGKSCLYNLCTLRNTALNVNITCKSFIFYPLAKRSDWKEKNVLKRVRNSKSALSDRFIVTKVLNRREWSPPALESSVISVKDCGFCLSSLPNLRTICVNISVRTRPWNRNSRGSVLRFLGAVR